MQKYSSRTPPAVPVPWPAVSEDADLPTLIDALGGQGPEALPRNRPSLTVLNGEGAGTLVRLGLEEVVFGRDKDAGVQLADASLSRRHARFFSVDDQVYVQDLGSTNGTFVAGTRIDAPYPLNDGDQIRLGSERTLRFNLCDALAEEALIELYESSVRDLTSGAFNRRYFEQRLEVEEIFARRTAQPLALLLLDIDEFKAINDRHGHVLGDVVLRVLAASAMRLLRPEDVLARYGGDEFVVLCRNTTLRNGLILAERIRSSVERLPFSAGGNEFSVTVSVGVAAVPGEGDVREPLIAAADRAMYRAKLRGRNSIAGSA
jgi:diguanylate cyclase (GGDEF)-like protein